MNAEPLREALLTTADRDAESVVAAARDQAAALVAAARADAASLAARARERSLREAAGAMSAARTAARAEARARVLAAQGEARNQIVRAASAAAADLPQRATYPELQERLARVAADVLGGDAQIDRDPPGGGIVARRHGELVDLTLPTLVARAAEAHAADMELAWR